MFSFQSLYILPLSKKLLLVALVSLPLLVFVFFLARRSSPSSTTQDMANEPASEKSISQGALPDDQDTNLVADSSALDSLQSGHSLGNIDQQSSDLDSLRGGAGKNVLSPSDVQLMELDSQSLR